MRNPRRAFTLIELLVVVAIIAILIAILLPSLSRAKDNAKKTVCASQLKTQGMLVALYATSFSDSVPYFVVNPTSQQPAYPNDQPYEFGNTLLDISQQSANAMNGAESQDSMRKIFWCPNNNIGIASVNQWSGNNVGNAFRTMGYAYFNIRQLPGSETGNWANLGQNLLPGPRVPPLNFLTKWSATNFSATTEFADDLMYAPAPSGPLAPDLSNIVWVAAAGDANYPNTSAGTLMVDHRKTYTGPPAGSNVLCCDGHVEWRAFAPGKMHYQKVNALFWFYPDP